MDISMYNYQSEMMYMYKFTDLLKRHAFSAVLLTVLLWQINIKAADPAGKNLSEKSETINYTVTVLDKATQAPLQYVVVVLKEENSIVANAATNPFGRAVFNDLGRGRYQLSTHFVGYEDFNDTVQVDQQHKNFTIRIPERNLELNEVVIQGNKIQNTAASIDMITGRQVFQGESYHASPMSSITQLIQQNLSGAVKAPAGEVHIRGMHGEFTYLVDGIPIPLGVFGGLNEIVDPKVISKITFYTGGFPAEFGGQLAGLMDIQNKVPTGKFQLDASTFMGSYLTSNTDPVGSSAGSFKGLNSNGQSLSLSDHTGKLGYFIGASRQETDRRIDQPVEQLFHDHGFDYFTYGKFDYLLNEHDYITMNLNYSKTQTEVPYDPSEGLQLDNQGSYNAFQTLSYFRTMSTEPDRENNLFIGGFAREGGLNFIPSVKDYNKIFLKNDTTNGYVVNQNRIFTTLGLRTKYDERLSHQFKYAIGFSYGNTFGKENFRLFNAPGDNFSSYTRYHGYDAGVFTESEWHPYEWTRLDLGLRYDVHNSPSVSNQYQLSPRVKLNLFINEFNSLSFSYDRLFMPTNIEGLGAVAYMFGNNAAATMHERDNLYEISFLRNWQNGFSTKFSGYYKQASPGLDDQTLGSSTIRVNVNIAQVRVSGFDFSLTYTSPETPFSGYVNASLIHAYGRGPVSGGFLKADSSDSVFDLDHDMRLSGSFVLNYQPANWFINMSANYSSGLTNGSKDYAFRTGLFDFNQGAHTTPSWIINLSGGYTFNITRGQSVEPSIYITNLLDHEHLLKGAFFSGASFEERRNIVFKLTYHL
ncbi:MAG: carboxypeptidase-like regulatory domain-containing protein [Syntrophomonadaceae bacterium]